MKTRSMQPQVVAPARMNSRSRGTSKQYCVWMNCAPAAIFFAQPERRATRRAARTDSRPRRGTRAARTVSLRPHRNRCSSRSVRPTSSSVMQSRSKTRLRLRVVARLHAVAGQAQHVAHAHRRGAQDVALDRDAVAVAAGDLHDRRVADARQERADGEARHVAVGAAAVGRVDRVDVAVEDARRGDRRPRDPRSRADRARS